MAESNSAQSNEPDEAAYLRMKRTISKNYPPGRLIAIHHGRIVADAERFQELKKALQQMGIDPAQSFVVEAGMDYPQDVVIFVQTCKP
jgi:hypothetical protein